MARCLSVQIITDYVLDQDGDEHLYIVSARPAQPIADNGQCNFDIAGCKVMIQDWHTGHVSRQRIDHGWSLVEQRVREWLVDND